MSSLNISDSPDDFIGSKYNRKILTNGSSITIIAAPIKGNGVKVER